MAHHRILEQAPPLTDELILAWADQHDEATGQWPRIGSGAVIGQPGETWAGVHRALHMGERGLPGGSSLPALLRKRRGVVAAGERFWSKRT